MKPALLALLLALPQDVPDAVKKAQAKLDAQPDDAEANLVVGRYMAFELGAFDVGLRLLAKGSDGFLKNLAAKDLLGAPDAAGQMDRGDEWIAAGPKRAAHRAAFQERASFWYRQAWASAQGPAREKIRERFRKFAAPPPGYEKPAASPSPVSGWDAPNDYWKALPEAALAHSGRQSMKILPAGKDNASGASGFNSQGLPALAGKRYELTAWVFTDRTDADGSFRLRIVDGAGKILAEQAGTVPMDSPFWQKVKLELDAPAGAFRWTVNFGAQIKQGAVWVDDVSVKVEGKELLKNGGFEEK